MTAILQFYVRQTGIQFASEAANTGYIKRHLACASPVNSASFLNLCGCYGKTRKKTSSVKFYRSWYFSWFVLTEARWKAPYSYVALLAWVEAIRGGFVFSSSLFFRKRGVSTTTGSNHSITIRACFSCIHRLKLFNSLSATCNCHRYWYT